MLDVALKHRLGGFSLDVAFTAGSGVTALFGRSGAGKTTVVNAIAGLLRPDQGRVVLDGRVLLDRGSGTWVPPHRRRIGYVFQEARLFPHLTVRQNLFYGRFFNRLGLRSDAFDRVVALLGIGALLDRRPRHLSGGERQRVAVGRALLAEPALLLLDEPLASLDAQRRAEILPFLERLRDEGGVPMVLVSHQMEEVVRLAGTLVLLEEGRTVAAGPRDEITRRPDLARLLTGMDGGAGPGGGTVWLPGRVSGRDAAWGLTLVRTPAGPLSLAGVAQPLGAEVRVRIRGRDVLVSLTPPDGLSARNALPARIVDIQPLGAGAVQVQLALGGEVLTVPLTARAVAELGLRPGLDVWAVIAAAGVEA